MKLNKVLAGVICASISTSAFSQSRSAQTQICYPTYKSEQEYCQTVLVKDHTYEALGHKIFGPEDIENGLTVMTNYGFEISDTLNEIPIDNEAVKWIVQTQKEKAIEAIGAVGGGPFLAIANIALQNSLTGGSSSPDPISQLAELILKRLEEVETRVIGRIDLQFQSQAKDAFAGMSQLYKIYGTANTIQKRVTPLYMARLAKVDTSLDPLLENFENDRFLGAHVKNYHTYLQLVALRLAVLAEVERITHYQLDGSLEGDHESYKNALNDQYQIVLSNVFDYIHFLAESNEWEQESKERFDFTMQDNGPKLFSDNQWEYENQIRPTLYGKERAFSDRKYSYRISGRNPRTVYKTYGHDMYVKTFNYKFLGEDQPIHISRYKLAPGTEHLTYVASDAFDGSMLFASKCVYGSRGENASHGCPKTDSSLMLARGQAKVNELQNKHVERAFHQFVKIYYEPTIEILDKWYELYRPGEQREKNRLDYMVDDMN